MLKLFFCLLLIANGVLFAMGRGYLGDTAAERHEPQRLSQQLQPQALNILPPNSEKLVVPPKASEPEVPETPASAAPAAPAASVTPVQSPAPAPKPALLVKIACTEIGNFNIVEARKFDAQLAQLKLPVKPVVRSIQEAISHMVYIPAQDGRDGAERKAAELRRLGIQDFYVMPESQANPALRWAISLGVFKTEEAAKAYIGQLITQGVRTARIMARTASTGKQVYQWRDIDAATKSALDGLKAKFPDQDMRSCAN